MEFRCKEKCQCCKACEACLAFQKILDLKDAGLVIYRYKKRSDEVDKSTGNIERSINATDDVFIIHNTKDIQIKTDECVTELGDEVSCPRCRELVQRAQKYLKNIPSIDKKDVISVCDHCKVKKQSIKYCCKCHDIVNKFIIERDKNSIGKEEIKTWLTKIHKLLSRNVVIDKITRLKYRAHSELYINKLCKDDVSNTRKLEVGPMIDVGVSIDQVKQQRIESARLIDKIATKSDSALKRMECKRTKFKSVESNSFIEIERRPSSSLEIYDTSLEKESNINKGYLEADSFERLRQKHQIDIKFAPKSAIVRHGSPRTLRRYYSDEKIFFSSPGFESLQNIKRNFSYVFPREESEQIRPLRRVKTSAELIVDTQDRLRLLAKLINDEIKRPLPKRSKITSSKKQKLTAKESDQKDIHKRSEESIKNDGEELEIPSSKDSKIEDKKIKSDKDKIQEVKKERLPSKKATTEDKEIIIDKDNIQQNIKEKPSSKKIKTEDMEVKRDKDKIQKDKKVPQKITEGVKGVKEEKVRNIVGKEDKKEKKEELQKEKKDKEKMNEFPKEKKDKEKMNDFPKEKEKKDKEKMNEFPKEKKDKEKMDDFPKEKERKDKEKMSDFPKEKEKKDKEKMDDIRKEKEKRKEFQKDKEEKEELQKGKEMENKEKKGKEKREETQKEKDKKENETQFLQALKDEEKKVKEEKSKNKDEKAHKGDENAVDDFRKMIEEQAKLKAEALNLKKQREEENKKLRMEAEKKTKETEPKLKGQIEKETKDQREREIKVEKKLDKQEPIPETKQEQPTIKELNIKQIKIRNPSTDDLILRLVRLKQATKKAERPKRLSQVNITPLMVKEHKVHKAKKINCAICVDSDLELDVENITNVKSKPDEVTDLIVGNKILKSKQPACDTPAADEMFPVLYKSLFKEDMIPKQQKENAERTTDKNDPMPPVLLSHKYAEPELSKGVIRYALSDRSFIDKGWTMLPTEKVVRKMNVYRMRPAHPEFDWFDRNKNKRLMLHDTGEKLAEFDDNGRGRWFYRNGRLALDYYDAEEMNAQQRFVIYGSGEPDERGRYQPIAILATFDYLGNGVVFDHTGKIRLKYNQTEGVVLDRGIGPVSHWKWHTLNDPPVLQQVMIDTQMAHKDPDILKLGGPADDKVRPDNEEMLAIEFDNFIKEKSKKLTQKFKPFQIRTKALKINDNFSLKVLDQANIYLIFRDGTTNIKINIGMILDHQEIVDTDTAEVGEVSNNLERFPARTDSLAGLQRSVAYAQRVERLRVERERKLKHPEKALSVDQLAAAASRPLRTQLNVAPSGSTETKDKCFCNCRKPSSSNVYYDTRLV